MTPHRRFEHPFKHHDGGSSNGRPEILGENETVSESVPIDAEIIEGKMAPTMSDDELLHLVTHEEVAEKYIHYYAVDDGANKNNRFNISVALRRVIVSKFGDTALGGFSIPGQVHKRPVVIADDELSELLRPEEIDEMYWAFFPEDHPLNKDDQVNKSIAMRKAFKRKYSDRDREAILSFLRTINEIINDYE